jgi:ABC-type dipeptide/oligopeptide/nickel transport system permease component
MIRFITKKLRYGLLVLMGVVVVVFFLFQGFGDPARLVLGQSGDSTTISNIKKELALDKPKSTQFLLYLNDVSPIALHTASDIESKKLKGYFFNVGDKQLAFKIPYLRRSYQSKKQVSEILMEAIPGTLLLAFAAMFVATLFGILLGMLAAIKKNTWMDSSAVFSSVMGISAPSFFMGIIIAYFFGFVLTKYTGLQMTGSLFNIDPYAGKTLELKNLILPALTLGLRPMAIITQLTRSAMLDVLDQDYIRTAKAKGLSNTRIYFVHALPNALNPVITAVTGWFAELLAGAFFVEYIFGWKGIGKVTVDALEKLDFPVVMGSVLVTATFFMLVNILADILYVVVDPRVKLTE